MAMATTGDRAMRCDPIPSVVDRSKTDVKRV